jgi:hypothetical protein
MGAAGKVVVLAAVPLAAGIVCAGIVVVSTVDILGDSGRKMCGLRSENILGRKSVPFCKTFAPRGCMAHCCYRVALYLVRNRVLLVTGAVDRR